MLYLTHLGPSRIHSCSPTLVWTNSSPGMDYSWCSLLDSTATTILSWCSCLESTATTPGYADSSMSLRRLANVLDSPTIVKRKRANSDHIDIFLISLLKQTTLIPQIHKLTTLPNISTSSFWSITIFSSDHRSSSESAINASIDPWSNTRSQLTYNIDITINISSDLMSGVQFSIPKGNTTNYDDNSIEIQTIGWTLNPIHTSWDILTSGIFNVLHFLLNKLSTGPFGGLLQ